MMRASVERNARIETARRAVFQDLHRSTANKGLFEKHDLATLTVASAPKGVSAQSSSTDGFVYQYLSYGEMCASQPLAAFGLAINQCLVDTDGNSYLYTCNENFATKTKFSGSSNCFGDSNTQSIPLGCTTEFNDDDIVNEEYVSLYIGCTTSSSDIQLPSTGQYGVATYYNEDLCSSTVSYYALANELCIPSGSSSFELVYPNLYTYPSSTGCVGNHYTNQTFFEQCTSTTGHLVSTDDNLPNFSFGNGALMSGGSSSNGPSKGAVAGVIIGCVVGMILIFVVIFHFVFFRKAKDSSLSAQESK